MFRFFLALIFVPCLVLSQQLDCYRLEVTDVSFYNFNNTLEFSIYNGNTNYLNYPHVGFTLNSIGDTLHKGNINLFGAPSMDTALYSYNLLNSSFFYPLSIYFIHFNNGIADTCILSYHPSCDSLNILFDSINVNNCQQFLHVSVQTSDLSNGVFGYGGLALLNEFGDTVAKENINNAGNVFGPIPYNLENRILEVNQNITNPFSGYIHLISGYFAGNSNTSCVYPLNFNYVSSNICEVKKYNKQFMIIDVFGRTKTNDNKILFHIFANGNVLKRIIIK